MFSTNRMRDLLNGPHRFQKLGSLGLVGIGWLLSPLCWWNDLLFNLPIALGFAKVAEAINPTWFVPGLVAGYWLSNIAGILLMQGGALGLLQGEREADRGRELLVGLLTSSAYTLGVVLLVKMGWLQAPLALLETVVAGGATHGSEA
jgi:hypothetical protein